MQGNAQDIVGNWNEYKAEAMRLFKVYLERGNPKTIPRMGQMWRGRRLDWNEAPVGFVHYAIPNEGLWIPIKHDGKDYSVRIR